VRGEEVEMIGEIFAGALADIEATTRHVFLGVVPHLPGCPSESRQRREDSR
jgi:hypothetical protein